MLVLSIQWVMALDLIALIGGIVGGVSLMTPQEPEMHRGRRW
jgi:hypothetical protein